MAPFATIEDVEELLNRDLTPGEAAQVQALLAQARAAIRSWTRQDIELVADETVLLAGTWSPDIVLPQRPVLDVSAVKVNGVALDAVAWQWNERQLLRRGAGPRSFDVPVGVSISDWPLLDAPLQISGAWHCCGPQATIEVTYTHGFDPIPDDVAGICKSLALRVFNNPTALVKEATLTYSAEYDQEARTHASGMGLTADDKAVLRRYRQWWV